MAENKKQELLERELAKQREIDKNAYLMYEETIKDAKDHYENDINPKTGEKKYTEEKKEEMLELLNRRRDAILEDYVKCGGNAEDLLNQTKKKNKTKKNVIKKHTTPIIPAIDEVKSKVDSLPDEKVTDAAYDLIPLPSKGEAYANKMDRLAVASLTAEDENVIANPNLYRDNLVMDVILRRKVLTDIDQADLIEGDRDAVILYLRSDGYGNEYPVTVTDDKTGTQFDAVVDLRDVHYKDFKLTGDENGWFDFKLPVSGSNVKFRFLRHRDILALQEMEETENIATMKSKIEEYTERIDEFIDNDNRIERVEKVKVREAVKTLKKWCNSMEEDGEQWTNAITNRLELSIMEVDGKRDRNYISSFVRNMKVKDSSALRRYITENEPGLDYNITVERPESLGGGSMELFLQLDQFIFLNIA